MEAGGSAEVDNPAVHAEAMGCLVDLLGKVVRTALLVSWIAFD
jgi:hypothetical protein